MNNNLKELKESPAIQLHINILQNIITRMASNSANCKTWAITIIAAILVLLFDKSKTEVSYLAYIPLTMFFSLDCFYLGMERHFREEYKAFLEGIEKSENLDFKNVYKIKGPKGICNKINLIVCGAWSFSTTPLYITLALAIFIVLKVS